MTIEITPEKTYIAVIIILSVLQIIQWNYLRKTNSLISDILEHVKVVTTLYGKKIIELENLIKKNEKKV